MVIVRISSVRRKEANEGGKHQKQAGGQQEELL